MRLDDACDRLAVKLDDVFAGARFGRSTQFRPRRIVHRDGRAPLAHLPAFAELDLAALEIDLRPGQLQDRRHSPGGGQR